MNSHSSGSEFGRPARRQTTEVSYKFQRLRERLRQAVLSGHLKGKLPGERALAKMYTCNAKTLSKALTDLAAEGLLDRSIGRGTYVKGSAPAEEVAKPWLVLGHGGTLEQEIVDRLSERKVRCQLVTGVASKRPSFLNQFSAVINLGGAAPDSLLRDLVVRSVPLVCIDCVPRTFSLDSVMVDVAHGVSALAREALHLGHSRMGVVEPAGETTLSRTARGAVGKHGTVDSFSPVDAVAAANGGVTILLCHGIPLAQAVMANLATAGVSVPGQVSVAVTGLGGASLPCSGAYVSVDDAVDQAIAMLGDRQPRRPAMLWLAPRIYDLGTLGPPMSRAPINLSMGNATMLGGMIPTSMVLLLIGAYLVGAIPFGYVVGKLKGCDVRKAGSGNIGATNVGRIFGRKYFFLVFFLDALKGFIPMMVAAQLVASQADTPWKYLLWMSVAFAVLAGHMFPIYLGFKGGKGVATSLGVMFGVFPYFSIAAVPALIVFYLTFKLTRIVSIASIMASVTFPSVLFVSGLIFGWHLLGFRWPLLATAVVQASIVIFRHRSNIARLRAGTEPVYQSKDKAVVRNDDNPKP